MPTGRRLRAARSGGKFVRFGDSDAFLLNSLCGFARAGLDAGEARIVVATRAHREALEEGLRAGGLDLTATRESGQYQSLDASETLSELTAGGCLSRRASQKWRPIRIV